VAAQPPNYGEAHVYGPFYRLVSPTQSARVMGAILASGELWGKPASWGGDPCVKAFTGALPDERAGFEFYTPARPNQLHSPTKFWYATDDGLVWEEDGMARMPLLISRVSQDIE